MGMMVDGRWTTDEEARTSRSGAFERTASTFRHRIGAEDGRFPAEAGRYHLFVNAGCPWAYRTVLYRSLKGLEEAIGMSFTAPAMGPEGWTFGEEPEPVLGARHIHDVYQAGDAQFTGRCTVPVLWDLETGTLVNNESADIIRMLDSAFDALPGVAAQRYYREPWTAEIDALNAEIYETVNNGVYRCGFARSQRAYDEAFDALFGTLDALDARLADRRYLCGAEITEADWRLFSTLVRFDLAYHGAFRCNRQRLADYAHLWPYTRDLYAQPGVAETVDEGAIKGIYYGSRAPGILPRGPDIDWTAPHGRERLA
jgi:putative glutathione S-transferase